jgi:hypothetical protein
MLNASKVHLTEANESYFEHLCFALTVAMLAIGAGLACLLHAFVPALCQRTCSRTVAVLQRLFADRSQLGAVIDETSAVLTFVLLTWVSTAVATVITIAVRDPILLLLLPQAFALPLIFLWGNPELATAARSSAA